MSFTILNQKDLPNPPRPLVLVTLVALDGDTVYYATAANANSTSVTYGGHTYECRLMDSNIDAIQAMSQAGFDQIPSFTLSIADPEALIWNGNVSAHGWRGATATLTFVLYDVPTQAYSTDAIQWEFLCENPTRKGGTISLAATSKVNAQQIKIPSVNIQYRCPWTFPTTLIQRQDGADNSDSIFYRCGYSPDATGANAVGNYVSGSTPFTTCALTREDCIAHGMFTVDSSSRTTGRFGGVTWVAPTTFVGTQYTTGRTFHTNEPGYNQPNQARYNAVIPWVYGTQWVDAMPLAPAADPNSLRFEAIICLGDVGTSGIQKVVCNGVEITYNNLSDPLYTWRYVNTGGRNGAVNTDAIFNGKGDPYGSICAIEVVIPAELGAPGSIPTLRVLVSGPKIRVYTTPTAFTTIFTTNPVWHLMDLCVKTGWTYVQMDIQTFLDAAAICDVAVPYTNLAGNSATHERWRSSFALEARIPASQAITMLRRSCGLFLHSSIETGLSVYIEQAVGVQQSTAVPGSNDTSGNNYGYNFDETTIDEDSFEITAEPLNNTPNEYIINFQDEDNQFQSDSLKQTDINALPSSGQRELPMALEVLGPCNFDETGRLANILLNKAQNGNPRFDHLGTIGFRFTASMRAVHLATRPGLICSLTWQLLGLLYQPFRVLSAKPLGKDGRKWDISGVWHFDGWYDDSAAQVPVPIYNNPFRGNAQGPPIPWKPDGATSQTWDPILLGASTFALQQNIVNQGNGGPQNSVAVSGIRPVNNLSSISSPFVPLSGTGVTSGGTIPAGDYVVQLAGIDSSGAYSQGSSLINVSLASTGELVIGGLNWDTNAVAYEAFVGSSQFTLQSATGQVNTTPPTSLTITTVPIPNSSYGPPDPSFYRFRVRAKPLTHNGSWRTVLWGALQVNAVNPTLKTIDILNIPMGSNEFQGRTLALVSAKDMTSFSPLYQDVIASQVTNTNIITGVVTTTLTMTHSPAAVNIGDWIQVYAQATSATSNSITDSKWTNSVGGGLVASAEIGNEVRIIGGTGAGQTAAIAANTSTACTISGTWAITPDTTSIFWIETANWTYDYEATPISVGTLDNAPTGAANVPVDNYLGRSVLIEILTEDQTNNFAPEYLAPIRSIYIPGAQGTRTVTSATTVTVSDGTINLDTTLGSISQSLPLASLLPNQTVTFIKTAASGTVTIIGAISGTVVLTDLYQSAVFHSDGTNWTIIGTTVPSAGGVNLQTASYAAISGDNSKLISFNSATAVTLTLPASPPSQTWYIAVENTGAGALTIDPGSLHIDGVTGTIALAQNQGIWIFTNGTNYYTERGGEPGGVNAQSGSYTAVAGDNTKLVSFNSSSAVTLTLPTTPPSKTWYIAVENAGTGLLTISPGSLDIDGAAGSILSGKDQGIFVFTDGTNYFTCRGGSSGGGVNAQTANYTAVIADDGKLISFNSGSAVTLTLPATPPSIKWKIAVENIGTGVLTINPNSLNLDGAGANVVCTKDQGLWIFTDWTNYFTERGAPASGGVNAQAANYTAVQADNSKLISFSSGSAVTLTLPSSPPNNRWHIAVENTGAGVLTVNPNGLNIDGGSGNVLFVQDQGLWIFTDGTNYFTERGAPGDGGVNTQTVNYTAVQSDNGKLISFNSGSALTLTLPSSPPNNKWHIGVESIGAGALTISPNGLNLDGSASSLVIAQDQGVWIYTDGTNYFTERGAPAGGSQPYDMWMYFPGVYDPSQVLFEGSFTRPVAFPANLSGSSGGVVVNPTATASIVIQKNGGSFATLSISTSGGLTFSCSATNFVATDTLTVIAPSSPDATLAGLFMTLVGTR